MDNPILMFVLEFAQIICMLTTALKNVSILTIALVLIVLGPILFPSIVLPDVHLNLCTLVLTQQLHVCQDAHQLFLVIMSLKHVYLVVQLQLTDSTDLLIQ